MPKMYNKYGPPYKIVIICNHCGYKDLINFIDPDELIGPWICIKCHKSLKVPKKYLNPLKSEVENV